jgi:hypothetical protein
MFNPPSGLPSFPFLVLQRHSYYILSAQLAVQCAECCGCLVDGASNGGDFTETSVRLDVDAINSEHYHREIVNFFLCLDWSL